MRTNIISLLILVFGYGLLTGCSIAEPLGEPLGENAEAIIGGSIDGDAHPAVVLVSMEIDGVPRRRCTGTLFSPTLVVTTGHCTGEPGDFSGMRIFTESDVKNGNNNFPFPGPNAVEVVAWHSHPLYSNEDFVFHDVGVIELASPVALPAGASYGVLPEVGRLDGLRSGPQTWFTAVGYGLQEIDASGFAWDLIRMNATPFLMQIDTGYVEDFSLTVSSNPRTGGTCFGDSGGPAYLYDGDEVVALTSFAMTPHCDGLNGMFRLDQADVIAFVNAYL